MRPTSTNVGTNIPAFLSKLWKMVNDPDTDHLICWSPGGHSFIIQNEAQFWYTLLPIYYKHNNMSSFIRQLNMYGFHKISSENGGMDCDKDEIKFFHPFFQQDQPNLMKHIKRKIATSKSSTATGGEENKVNNVDQISKVLVDVKQLRGRQESVDSQLAAMKQENAALWRELALLRQKHMKQQQIVNKLIHFLVTIVQPSRSGLSGLGVKRRYPLMINDSKYTKVPKTNASSDGPTIHELDAESALTDSLLNEAASNEARKNNDNQVRIDSPPSVNSLIEPENVLLNIPIEETDSLPDDPLNTEILLVQDPDLDETELITPDSNVENLLTSSDIPVDPSNSEFSLKDTDLRQVISDKDILRVAEQMYDNRIANASDEPGVSDFEDTKPTHLINPNMKDAMISNVNLGSTAGTNKNKAKKDKKKSMTVATRSVPDLTNFKVNNTSPFSDDLDTHLEATQGELDTIKDMLFEGYSLDANALLGLFNPDEDFPLDIPPLTNPEESSKNQNDNCDPMMSGSELTAYVNPPFVLDFENLFEDSADAAGCDTTETTMEALPGMDGQINTPVVIKKEPTYPVAKRTNSK